MGTYRKEWSCCNSVTETDAWEPETCPFCAAPSPTGESLSAAEIDDMCFGYAPSGKIGELRQLLNAYRQRLAPTSVQGVAAAGQELTDADIDRIVSAAVKKGDLSWLGYRKDEDGVYTVPVLSPGHYQLCRAIARHLAGDTAALPGEGL